MAFWVLKKRKWAWADRWTWFEMSHHSEDEKSHWVAMCFQVETALMIILSFFMGTMLVLKEGELCTASSSVSAINYEDNVADDCQWSQWENWIYCLLERLKEKNHASDWGEEMAKKFFKIFDLITTRTCSLVSVVQISFIQITHGMHVFTSRKYFRYYLD